MSHRPGGRGRRPALRPAGPHCRAGTVCLYETHSNGVVIGLVGFAMGPNTGDEDRRRFTVQVGSSGAGVVDARGAWAYTAP